LTIPKPSVYLLADRQVNWMLECRVWCKHIFYVW